MTLDELVDVWLFLLFKTGAYRLVTGLNNAEVYLADDLLKPDYVGFHFNKISLNEKDKLIKRIYLMLEKDKTFALLSKDWQQSLLDRNQKMQQLTHEGDLHFILQNIPELRHLEGYYLRSITINLFNSTVSMSFNCDGMQVISHKNFITGYL